VPGEAISDAGTVAVNRELLTNVVVSAVPFHCTTEAGTNPVPLMVTLKLVPPGVVAAGTGGLLTNGIGLDCAPAIAHINAETQAKPASFMDF
jgi:hypothetical protein